MTICSYKNIRIDLGSNDTLIVKDIFLKVADDDSCHAEIFLENEYITYFINYYKYVNGKSSLNKIVLAANPELTIEFDNRCIFYKKSISDFKSIIKVDIYGKLIK